MIDYRTYLTGLVAVFLALGLGMLLGSVLITAPSPKAIQVEMRKMQQDLNAFREENADTRSRMDALGARLRREDDAVREILLPRVNRRLAGRRIALVLCGEITDVRFLGDVNDVLEQAGATVISTTRVSDDWIPPDDTARGNLLAAFGLSGRDGTDARATASLARALALGHEKTMDAAATAASGLRLDGDYTRSPDAVLVVSGTRTPERYAAARVGATPETAMLPSLRDVPVRVVAAEPDGDDGLSTIPFWSRLAPATVDNIDMASGQLSAVYALAGRDGHFGIKGAADRAIPDLNPAP